MRQRGHSSRSGALLFLLFSTPVLFAAEPPPAANLQISLPAVQGSDANSGAVTADKDAGAAEASLLAAQAVEVLADRIADAIPDLPTPNRYIIFSGTQRPSFGHWRAFELRTRNVSQSFESAGLDSQVADLARAEVEGSTASDLDVSSTRAMAGITETAAVAGDLLNAAAKIGSYFLTDYHFGPVPVTGSDSDLLALAVSGKLSGSWYPAYFPPPTEVDGLSKQLDPLIQLRSDSLALSKRAKHFATIYSKKANSEKTPAKKAAFLRVAAAYSHVDEAVSVADKLLETFLSDLFAADKDGIPLVASILAEQSISDALDSGSRVLFVRLNMAAGGFYTKKNLWTFFGSMPFFVMGGAIASYAVYEGTNGEVVAAGGFAHHSGYFKVSQVEKRFSTPSTPKEAQSPQTKN